MNKIINIQDQLSLDFKNLWELKNPKFHQAPDGTNEALPQYKLRRSGSVISFITNYLTPSRLFGVRKFFAWLLWLFIVILIFATVYAYQTGSGEMGQLYFTLFFIGLYFLFFIKAGKSRLGRWSKIYTKAVKTDLGTHTNPAIIFDGTDVLLANERIFDLLGDRPIAAFVDDYQGQLKYKEKLQADSKKATDKEKTRFKKEKEDKEFKEALAVVGPLVGSGLKNLVREGGASTRAARAARGLPPRPSNETAPSTPNYVKIEGYTGSYWETCASGLDNNANYIATRLQQIRKSNPRYTKLRAVDGKGRIVDVA